MTAIRRPLPPLRRRQSDRATAHIPAFTASPAGEMHGVPRHPVSTIHVVRDVYVWGAVLEGKEISMNTSKGSGRKGIKFMKFVKELDFKKKND